MSRDPELEDQPPEVTTLEAGQPGSLPPVSAAAHRVAEFLRRHGDGEVVPRTAAPVSERVKNRLEAPLYARDLESLVQHAEVTT